MTDPWTPPDPWPVPQDFYDALTELPNGSDVTDCFDQSDPPWKVTSVTMYHTTEGHMVLSCNKLMIVKPAPAEEN